MVSGGVDGPAGRGREGGRVVWERRKNRNRTTPGIVPFVRWSALSSWCSVCGHSIILSSTTGRMVRSTGNTSDSSSASNHCHHHHHQHPPSISIITSVTIILHQSLSSPVSPSPPSTISQCHHHHHHPGSTPLDVITSLTISDARRHTTSREKQRLRTPDLKPVYAPVQIRF